MSNKKKFIFENNNINDSAAVKGTDIILSETGTGKVLFRGSNKVLVSGSEYNALKDFNFDPSWNSTGASVNTQGNFLTSIPSYDVALSAVDETSGITSHALDTPVEYIPFSEGLFTSFGDVVPDSGSPLDFIYKYFTRRVCLFCVGIDGCGIEDSRVYRVSNTKFIAPYTYAAYDPGTGIIDPNTINCLIPFKTRVVDSSYNTDLTVDERETYFGRSTVGSTISYYFKAFDGPPTLYRRYADDSASLGNVTDVWKDKRKSDAEVVVQLKMSIAISDCREYFNLTTGANTSKINTISLCTAIPYFGYDRVGNTSTRRVYYKDIRPFTKFNFSNESLIDTSKGIDITYYLYY